MSKLYAWNLTQYNNETSWFFVYSEDNWKIGKYCDKTIYNKQKLRLWVKK